MKYLGIRRVLRRAFCLALLAPACVGLSVSSAVAGGMGGSGHSIQVGAFYKLDHKTGYPKEIKGDEAALFTALEGKAHYIFMSNASGVMNNDVINIQSDLLRGKADASFEDYGANCSLAVMIDESGADKKHQLTGTCSIFLIEHDGSQLKEMSTIPPTELPDIEKNEQERWKLIFEEEHGLGIYANAVSN